MFDRSSWNMFGISAGVSALAFGFSLLSTTKINLPLKYSEPTFRAKVESFSDIEDLEYTKGCKFYFFDSSNNRQVNITNARNFKVGEGNKTKMFEAVKTKINDCTKNRYFYIRLNSLNFLTNR